MEETSTQAGAERFVDRVMALWAAPIPDHAAFAHCYAADLTVNGVPFTLADLVERARALHRAYSDIRPEVVQVVAAPGHVVVAFLMHVRHTGTLPTPFGPLPATGREAAARTIDILTVRDERITDISVVADELTLLTTLGALPLGE